MGAPPSRGHAALVAYLARVHLAKLTAAIRRRDWPSVLTPARALSGLGPGLTPSGDDVLAGLALGYRAGHGALPDPLAGALLAAVEGRTTELAAARVQHAVAGRPDESVHRLLIALVADSGADLDPAVRAVAAYGHSSGADTLVGLIVGLALGLGAPG